MTSIPISSRAATEKPLTSIARPALTYHFRRRFLLLRPPDAACCRFESVLYRSFLGGRFVMRGIADDGSSWLIMMGRSSSQSMLTWAAIVAWRVAVRGSPSGLADSGRLNS
ncbi:hypothetical protein Dimus_037232, partial [Dionaea muscipula]